METFLQDLRFSWRKMLRTPGFTVAILLCLALGIGANTAMFSFARSLLLPPSQLKDPDQLVRLFIKRSSGLKYGSFSYPDYLDIRDRSSIFTDLAVETPTPMNVSLGGRNERFWGALVSPNYFETLGIEIPIGRSFEPRKTLEPGSDPVVVLGHGFWQRRFGGDPGAVGRKMVINGHPFTIIGVAPAGFQGADVGFSNELWVPMRMYQTIAPGHDIESRGQYWLGYVIGRLRPGLGVAQARARLDTLMAQLATTYPETNVGKSVSVFSERNASIHPMMRGAIVGFVGLMFTVVGLVLLLACVNVAGLLIARAAARRREVAVRLALGVSRRRLLRQLLTESTVLAVVAGLLGLLLSLALVRLIQAFRVPVDFPVSIRPHLDLTVLAFTILVSLVTGLVFGLAPALEATRTDLVSSLKTGTPGAGSGSFRLRKILTAGQVCLSMVLLIGASLALEGFHNANQVDLGFRPDHLAIASVDLDLQGYPEAKGRQFVHELKQRLGALPGVTQVGYANVVPMSLSHQQAFVLPQDFQLPKDSNRPIIGYDLVGPGYFAAMKIPLLKGRRFTQRDNADGPPVAIVNQAFADKYWPNQNALGKHLEAFSESSEVVGVVQNGKYFSLGEAPLPYLYLPIERHYRGNVTFFVRTQAGPASLLEPVRHEVTALDSELPVYNLKTMKEQLRFALLPARLAAVVISAFAGLALFLSAVGLFAVVSYWVGQRIRDIAIRRAIGAPVGKIVKLVVWQGVSLASIGLALGLGIGWGLSRLAAGLLYGLDTSSPVPFLLAALVLLAVVLLATLLPTRRALRVGVVHALRSE